MKRVLWLVLVCLLTAVLVLSSCTESTSETPPQAETETTKTALPTPTQTRPLPSLDAFMKGIVFADWLPFDASQPKLGFDTPPSPPKPGLSIPPPPRRLPYTPSETDSSLKDLATTGANWIQLIVNVGQETIASTTIFSNRPRTATDTELQHVIDFAHSLGMRVLLRPQVSLSNDPEHWYGLIGTAFTSEAQWQEWFTSYRGFINHYAAFAQEAGVDMLSLGEEMGGVTHREDDWRRIVQEVRQRFKGPITYCSMGGLGMLDAPFPYNENKLIKWWDAVDYIGVNVYYPLTDKNDPTVAEIKAAWTEKGYIAHLESLSSRFNKPIIFTEFGYPSIDGANKQPAGPAGYLTGKTIDLQEQADCYQAALEVLWDRPWLKGIFWFQWWVTQTCGPNDVTMTPCGKPAEEVVKKYYLANQ